jgi:hypothetical protein
MRNIVVDGKTYKWKCGSCFVDIRDDKGNRVGPPELHASTVKGITPEHWERGQWKITYDGMLRPREVAAFIKNFLNRRSE